VFFIMGKIEPGQMVVDCDMTIAQWRQKRNFSRWDFYKLKKQGRAPEILNGRITQKADAEWHRRERRLAKSAAARLADQRKSEMARMAGRIAAKSPRHRSNRKVS
jgi:hypothetical protein